MAFSSEPVNDTKICNLHVPLDKTSSMPVFWYWKASPRILTKPKIELDHIKFVFTYCWGGWPFTNIVHVMLVTVVGLFHRSIACLHSSTFWWVPGVVNPHVLKNGHRQDIIKSSRSANKAPILNGGSLVCRGCAFLSRELTGKLAFWNKKWLPLVWSH